MSRDIGAISSHLSDIDNNFAKLIANLAGDKGEATRSLEEQKKRVDLLHDDQMRRLGRQQVINWFLGASVGVFALIQIAQFLHLHVGS